MMTRSDERGETNYGLRNDLNNLRLTQERQSESGFGSGSSVGTNVRLGRNPSYVSGIANSQVTPSFNGSEASISRNLIPSRTSSNGDRDIGARSHRLVKITVIKEPSPGLTTEVSRKQLGQFPSENLARNFEIFETHPIQEEVTIPSTINGFAQAKALLENVDKIRIPSYDEIFDYLRIAKKWSMKRKAKTKLLDRISQILNNKNNFEKYEIELFDELLSKEEFQTLFQHQIKRMEQQIGQMERELDSMEEITADSIHNWIELLSHCLIQPRLPSCEKLFIMVKDVFCAALEKRVIWDKDLMTSFMRINIIQHCSELQRLIYESLGKYLEGLSDGTRHADLDKLYADWGLLEDDLMAPLRYCAIAKSWNSGISPGTMAGDSFIKRFLESGMTTPLYMQTPGGNGHVSFDMLTCALNAQNWDAAKYIMNIYFKDSLTLKCAEDSTNKREHQRNSCIQTRKFKPPYLIHMEYFIEEIESKVALDFFMKEFSAILQQCDIITAPMTADDVESDHLSLLQKAVAQNKIELIEKFITEFKMDLNRTSNEYPLPPIFIALSKRKVRSTEKLIQAGADLMRKIFIDGNELNIFDVICSNKVSFHRTEDKTRRIMAKQFERKVIEDARKCGVPYPQTSSRPHYHSAFSNWPKLPPIKYRNNENLRQFHSN